MVTWYFVFLAFIPQHTTIDTVGPFGTKEQCEKQRKAVVDMTTERMLLNGYMHSKKNIIKDVQTWDCYPIPAPKKPTP